MILYPASTCCIPMCPRPRAIVDPFGDQLATFCAEHEVDYAHAPEGLRPRNASRSDFRDRVWKETCALDEAKKRAQAERDATSKLVADALERSKPLVRDAVKLGQSISGPDHTVKVIR